MENTTRQGLPIVASVIGQKLGIPVIVGGDQACTDGARIIVPNVESEAHKDVAYGYIVHEAAHIRYSDFENHGESPLVHTIANILEDVRIERAIAREYPGAPTMIRKVVEHMVDTGLMATNHETPVATLVTHILFRVRKTVLKQDCLAPLAQEQERLARETFPEGVMVRLHGILAGADKTGSTRECTAMAKRILLMLEEEAEKERQRAPQPSSSQTPPADQPEGSGQGASPDDASDGDSDGDSENPEAAPDTNKGASAEGADDAAKRDVLTRMLSNQDALPEDMWDQAAALLQNEGGNGAYAMPCEQRAKPVADATFVQRVAGDSARIAAALAGLVQSERQEHRAHRRHGRKIDTGKLHRTMSGDTKVFLREQRREAVNASLHVLLDLSGSMRDNRKGSVAKDAAMALALALDRIPGVTQALTIFPGPDIPINGKPVPSVTRVLARREDPRRIAGTLSQCAIWGGTPMTEALYYAASRLVVAPEHRKTILVITDGEPNDVASCKTAVQQIMRAGITVCGIGIMTMSVQGLFPEHGVIRNVQELRNALFTMARRILAPRAA